MTTFTKLRENEQPVLAVYPSRKLSKIDNNIYGGFTEHMGRCIYGGLYDPENPNKELVDEDGFRKDVIEAMKELNVPVEISSQLTTGSTAWDPREKRPKRPELAWLGVESNQFGTDEFMKWCEVVGTEPYLCLNMGTGTLDEALGWLEYCNSTLDTHYANLRRQNGREKPYGVKYWALGNECYGPWQVEQMNKEDYAKKAYQWAKALKLLDPTITLISCGKDGVSPWDSHVLRQCLKRDQHVLSGNNTAMLIDMHSIHQYTMSHDPIQNAFAPRSAELAIEICASMINQARIQNQIPASYPTQKLCFDEWNVWSPQRAPGEQGAEEKYTLSDALAVAIWLNIFVRQSKYLGMANIAQSVNVISPLMTTTGGLVKQTTWWPLLLFSKYMRGWTVATHTSCACFEGETEPHWLRSAGETPWLDVSATVNEEGWVSMVVVNVHPEEKQDIEIDGLVGAAGVDVYTITGNSWDDVNTAEREIVGIQQSRWDGSGKFSFAAKSITMLRWQST